MTWLYPYVIRIKGFNALRKPYESIQDQKVQKEISVTDKGTKFAFPCACIFRDSFETAFIQICT